MKELPRLLVASADKAGAGLIAASFSDSFEIVTVSTGSSAFDALRSGGFSIMILDLEIRGCSAQELLRKIRTSKISITAIVLTPHEEIDKAAFLVRLGAYDFVIKPADAERLRLVVKNALEKKELQDEIRVLREDTAEPSRLNTLVMGGSATMQRIYSSLERVVHTESTILVTGESGTGKGVLARAIHQMSIRSDQPFRAVDCSAIPEDLIASELFGHEKGSFTGALSRKTGKFEAAGRGTLFVDEIANISLDIQAKLLRVIQEREFERIGSNEVIKLESRIIAATNRDLKIQVREGKFREDLFYRLNVVPVFIPPLRERRDDIPLFVDFFLESFNREYLRDIAIDIEGRLFLVQYDWPGNIRQLENVIRRLVLLSPDGAAGRTDVERILNEEDILPDKPIPQPLIIQSAYHPFCDENGRRKTLAEIEKEAIIDALISTDYNISETAKLLGVARKTMHNKLKDYEIVIRKRMD